jgi:coenzyme F420-reducing hydrogenase gamma subunit
VLGRCPKRHRCSSEGRGENPLDDDAEKPLHIQILGGSLSSQQTAYVIEELKQKCQCVLSFGSED